MTATPPGPGPDQNRPSDYPGAAPYPGPGPQGGPAPSGWQPYPGSGAQQPAGPPPARPASITWAVRLLVVGGVISLISLVVGLLTAGDQRGEVADQLEGQGTDASPEIVDAAFALGIGAAIVFGLVGAVLWFWMAWKNGQGRGWARILATVLGGLNLLLTGGTLLVPGAGIGLVEVIVSVVTVLVGVAVLILLWRPESSRFYAETAARRAY
ncbi:MAG: hypothetical protein Q7T56_11425 [Nocardioidaceae bacterium]|nr:hypothetical protein [Nocardioidaceae bacterium]